MNRMVIEDHEAGIFRMAFSTQVELDKPGPAGQRWMKVGDGVGCWNVGAQVTVRARGVLTWTHLVVTRRSYAKDKVYLELKLDAKS